MNIRFYKWALLISVIVLTACDKFLDQKPDQRIAVPKGLADAMALLNDYNTINTGYPSIGEAASDDYFLSDTDWNALSAIEARDNYIWEPSTQHLLNHWLNPYRVIYQSNQVLAVLREVEDGLSADADYLSAAGRAYFLRAYALHQLAGVFAPPYSQDRQEDQLGVPIKLLPDVNEPTVRPSLRACYSQMIDDAKGAVHYLQPRRGDATAPSREAAYALLARIYIDMADYEQAALYADSCLQVYAHLMDFKTLDSSRPFPFDRFNGEVIFHALSFHAPAMGAHVARIDSVLIGTYHPDDLRKQLFFNRDAATGYHSFRGSYDGTVGGLFNGLTTAEMYLIRSESHARTGYPAQAREGLKAVLASRYTAYSFDWLDDLAGDELIHAILDEYRKEMVFRGRRWATLRRLNQDTRFQKKLVRILGDERYELPPNDLRYTLLIPEEVIVTAGIIQNER